VTRQIVAYRRVLWVAFSGRRRRRPAAARGRPPADVRQDVRLFDGWCPDRQCGRESLLRPDHLGEAPGWAATAGPGAPARRWVGGPVGRRVAACPALGA